MTVNMINKEITVSEQEMANIIVSAVVGYTIGVMKTKLSIKQIEFLQEVTLESIQEGGFIEELIDVEKCIKDIENFKLPF